MNLNSAINSLNAINPDFTETELLSHVRNRYRAYCPRCGTVLSFAEYHLSNDDYLGACLECDEDFYAVECYLEEVTE